MRTMIVVAVALTVLLAVCCLTVPAYADGVNLSELISKTYPITKKCAPINGEKAIQLTENTPAKVYFKTKDWVSGYLVAGETVYYNPSNLCMTRMVRCGNPAIGMIKLPPPKVVQVPVPGPERIVKVPGPERIVEVPGPERVVEVEKPVFYAVVAQAPPMYAVVGAPQTNAISFYSPPGLSLALIDTEGDRFKVSAEGGKGDAAAAAAATSTSATSAATDKAATSGHQGAASAADGN